MTNQNQRIQAPFGDIFLVNTSYTDRAAAQLYAEQKQREAKQQQLNAALDDEFSKNLAGIRDADIPELTQKYTDWKLANIGAMKQKGGISPQQQMDLLKKKSEMYGVINESKQRKQYEEEVGKNLANPNLADAYEDNAHQELISHRQMPLNLLKQNGLLNYDYSYKGTNTDFSKILTAAAGQPKQVYQEEKPVDKEGIQTQITPYMFGNTPTQFYDNLVGSLAQRKAGRDAAAIIKNTDPNVIAQVQDAYNKIPTEKWQKMGIKDKQELTIKPDDTPAIAYAKHEAQLYALNNEPKQGMPKLITNEAARMAKTQAQQKELARFRNSLNKETQEGLIKLRQKVKDTGDAETNNVWVDNYLTTLEKNAKPSSGFLDKTGLTQLLGGGNKDIVPDPVLYNALNKPDRVIITPKGEYKVTYYNFDKEGKPTGIDESRSGTFTKQQIKLALGYKATGKNQLTEEMSTENTNPLDLDL